jgi:hypothetical protein
MRIDVDLNLDWGGLLQSLKKQYDKEMEKNPSADGFVSKVWFVEAIAKYIKTRPDTTVNLVYQSHKTEKGKIKLLNIQKSTITTIIEHVGYITCSIGIDNILWRLMRMPERIEIKTVYIETPQIEGNIKRPPMKKLKFKIL